VADDLAPVWTGEQALTVRHRSTPGGPSERIAAGFERLEPVTAEVAGQPYRWQERHLVRRSCPRAQAGERGLRARLAQAPAAVMARNQCRRGPRRGPDPRARRPAVDPILRRERGQGLRHVRDQDPGGERPRRRDGRRDTTGRLEGDVQVTASLAPGAVAAAGRQRGWRVSVTPQPPAPRSRQAAVLAYRQEDLVERARGRLNGRPWSLPPRDLERDDQATGVIRRWSLGWRVLTRLELGVRPRWATAKPTRAGWSVGTPTRATARPTAERLREALPGLTLTIIRDGRRQRSPLTSLARVPRRLRTRLTFPVDLSMKRGPDAHQPPSK
jgi:hypothetical protein